MANSIKKPAKKIRRPDIDDHDEDAIAPAARKKKGAKKPFMKKPSKKGKKGAC